MMEGILKADIFFVVTTIVIVFVAIAVIVAVVYVILILRDIKNISFCARKEIKHISEDLVLLRENTRSRGLRVVHFLEFLSRFFKRNRIKNRRKK